MTYTETTYIYSTTSLETRLARIYQIIEALEIRALDVTGQSNLSEYSLDDGQIKVKSVYNSPAAIAAGIAAYEKLAEKLLNKLNGRGFVLRPWQGLR